MDHYDGRAAAAESLAEAGRWREAAEAYAEVIKAGRSDYRIHFNYGTVLMHCDHYEAGRDQLCAALRYRPDSLEALNNLAVARLKLGNPCAAEETCHLIIAKDPDHHVAWTNLGLALSNQGRVIEGIEAMQRALEIAPDYGIARDNLLLNLNYVATDGHDLAVVHQIQCADLSSSPRKPLPETTGRRIRVG